MSVKLKRFSVVLINIIVNFELVHAVRKIALNTGANATKFFTLATKS